MIDPGDILVRVGCNCWTCGNQMTPISMVAVSGSNERVFVCKFCRERAGGQIMVGVELIVDQPEID